MAKESTFKNMTICLTAVCLLCSALLGVVYVLTQKPIADAALAKTNNAIALVVPEFDNVPSDEKREIECAGEKFVYYTATKGEEVVGYAIETSTSKGFSGTIKAMVGFNTNGDIVSISVLSHSETPGLGAKMTDPSFAGQFEGKNPSSFKLAVRKDGGDIDAITASTITSRAYADAVQKAYNAFNEIVANNK
jgi:electron transport complex protein RnfG